MIEIILVRHGITDSTLSSKYCGWTDIPLNNEGKTQADRLKKVLSSYKPIKICASPLKRTVETANIINNNFKLNIEFYDALKEYNFGIWENKTYEEVIIHYHREYNL